MIRPYLPEHSSPQHNAGIVLLNHVGSSVSQDTGRDAQVLANEYAMVVIAADRPGTDNFFPSRRLARQLASPAGYVAAMHPIGERIDDVSASYGLDRLLVTGRSAGAVGALALTVSGTLLRQRALFAVEPVALEQMTVQEGQARITAYQVRQKQLIRSGTIHVLPDRPGLPKAASLGRALSIPPRYALDRFHTAQLWASDATLIYADEIASWYTDIDTTIEFAEHSLAGDSVAHLQMQADISQNRDVSEAPFVVTRTMGTVHASYDKRSFMTERLRPIVERMLAADTN